MIHEKDRIILQHLINSSQWSVLTNVAKLMISQIAEEPTNGVTIDEIAIHSIKRDAQIYGIKRLLQEINNVNEQK